MKLPNIKILDEKEKLLHQKSQEVTFPLSKEDKQLIKDSLQYLEMSQIEKYNQQYNLRAGMGLAFPQLGLLKRIFVIVNEYDEQKFEKYVVINPRIISVSEEMVYVGEGEGCLSVNRETEGIVPRHARITVEAYDENGKLYTFRAREELAVAFQHEIDHLNGILFVDKINKQNPFKDRDTMREI